jgi:hypothetical protein
MTKHQQCYCTVACLHLSLYSSVTSTIFLKKIVSGTHSAPKFSQKGGGVTYARKKKRFWNIVPVCIVLRKTFWNIVPVPSQKHPGCNLVF